MGTVLSKLAMFVNSFLVDVCTCTGASNQHNEGSECEEYSGYSDEWYNGVWCYAETATCSDAKAHPSETLPGLGGSHLACRSGKLRTFSDNRRNCLQIYRIST